ncbi:single-stranded DNA-binding protein [Curtobacterium sp. 20TX0008]|uniref:single-stranded DNA-binding protein n=1 Tax=Curtobacterium sp. 20TX0008 TaxID=3022018 RepID=UPI00232B22FA|nr:single-stranded DNA-binding protein [Curtobacterium sp. 20TX0008]MDB6425923.1 single-stranded DNA-binding protein [Curtobacterium sp. 20TX0008]
MTDTSAAFQAPQQQFQQPQPMQGQPQQMQGQQPQGQGQGQQPNNEKQLITPFGFARGQLTADPELRYTQNNKPVANFTIASTERVRDRQTGEYVDGTTTFYRCTVWDAYAEHVAASLTKGMTVLAQGRVYVRGYTNQQQQRGFSVDMDVAEVGPTLRWGTTVFTKAAPNGAAQGQPLPQTQQFQQPAPQGQAVGQPQQFQQQAPQGQPVQQQQFQQQAPQGQPAQQGQPTFQFQGAQPTQQVAQVGAGVAAEAVF